MANPIILCHGDCDGIISGAIALAANPGSRIFLTSPVKLADDLKRIKAKVPRIIIADIALNDNSLEEIFNEMRRLKKAGTEIIYIDHHPLPEGIKRKDIPASITVHKGGSASELTFAHFQDKLSWEYKILAAIGAIGDYEMDTTFAQEVLRDYDYRSLSFQSAIIVQALGEAPTSGAFRVKKSLIERLALGLLPSELNDLVERAMRGCQVERFVREYVHKNFKSKKHIGYILDIPTGGGFVGKGALFAATAADKPVGVCGNSRGDRISMSIRRRDENVDLNLAARRAGKAAKGTGGGHPSAAGATVKYDKWEAFLNFLEIEVSNQLALR